MNWKPIGERSLRAVREAAERWAEQGGATMAASIAFYAAFSIVPSLILVMLIGAAAFGQKAAQGQLLQQLSALIGTQNADLLQGLLVRAWKARYGAVPTVTSILAIVIASSGAFTQLDLALNAVWDIQVRPPPASNKSSFRASAYTLLRSRALSFALVVGMGLLLILLMLVDALLQVALTWLQSLAAPLRVLFEAVRLALLPLTLAAMFGVLLRVLPAAPLRIRDVAAGAVMSALLFMAGKGMFAIYLVRAGTTNLFGAAGSLAVLLMWLYYSAAVFLYGAHFGAAWTRSRPGSSSP